MTSKFNRWFKRIALCFELTKKDTVETHDLDGVEVSNSLAEGWRKSPDDRKFRLITESEFDAFTEGLVEWSREENYHA